MKRVTALAVTLCLLSPPAFAQMGGGKHGHGDTKKGERKGPAVDEKAYDAALKSIPDSKVKVDPWGQMRPSAPAKKPN
jgi:uncharacterized protein YdeI (BOF family)